jgi:hypothetical protein
VWVNALEDIVNTHALGWPLDLAPQSERDASRQAALGMGAND